MRTLVLWVSMACCVWLTACGQVPLSYSPTVGNLEALRAANIAPVSVGVFSVAPDAAPAIDKSVPARGMSVTSPNNNSFASFIKDALAQELRAAGRYDPQSGVVISGLLTKNELDASMGTGKAALAANFVVTRDGTRVYNKVLEEKADWPSAFIGADAIPTAISQYTSLYKKLLGKLFGDNDFKLATQAK